MAIYGGPDIITDGLVLHLDAANVKSYPTSGNLWYDLSDKNHTFQLHNGAFWENTGSSSSIVFDGDNDNAGASVSASLQLKNDKSLAFWFNHYSTTVDNQSSLIRVGLGSDLLYCVFCNKGGRSLTFHWYDNTFRSVNTQAFVYLLDKFNYGCISISGTSITFYVNGLSVGTGTVTIPSPASASLVGIGATRSGASIGSTSQDFAGKISVVKIYNRALNLSEIQQNYNALKGRFGL